MTQHEFLLRELTANDLTEYIHLNYSVGWSDTIDPAHPNWQIQAQKFDLFLAIGTMYGHFHGESLISCAGVFPFGSELASIGMVMVHPEYQRNGLGSAIMKRCLEETERSGSPAMLLATAQGQELYKTIGFKTIDFAHRLVRNVSAGEVNDPALETSDVERIIKSDVTGIIEADRIAIGADRSRFFNVCAKGLDLGFVIRGEQESETEIKSFGLGVVKGDLLMIAPLVAEQFEQAKRLVHNFISEWNGPVRIEVPGEQHEFIEYLKTIGFADNQTSPVMLRDAATLPGDRTRLYGLADPALG